MVVAPDKPTPGDPPPRQQVDQTDLQDGDIQKEVEEEVRETVVDDLPVSGSNEYVTINKLSHLTGLSRSLLYARANNGELPGCRRLGSRILIHLPTFEDYLKSGNGQYDVPRKPRKPRKSRASVVPKGTRKVEKSKAPFWRILGI